jgi:hypothetical protein
MTQFGSLVDDGQTTQLYSQNWKKKKKKNPWTNRATNEQAWNKGDKTLKKREYLSNN